jgi:hypothetical protein
MSLIIEDPAGYKGFWSDSGHLSIWISDVCVGTDGVVDSCGGGDGTVLSSTSYWSASGWAAIPARLYFEGKANELAGVTWSNTLSNFYPAIPVDYGRKYIGRLGHRGAYVIRIHTSSEEDSEVIERIQRSRNTFRYAVFYRNCSDFARQILDLYFPGQFRRKLIPDFGISTPHGVANRFWKVGQKNPQLQMQVYYIPRRNPGSHLLNGPTKGICEAAVTDVKYAVPLLIYQPVIYAAFAACYLATDQPPFLHRGFRQHVSRVSSFDMLTSNYEATIHPQPALRDTSHLRVSLQESPSAAAAAEF